MFNIRLRTAAGTAALAALLLPAAHASDPAAVYPDRPIRIVVPYGAGGAADILARVLAEGLTKEWHQSVIVENKPGGVGTIGTTLVVKAAPDGYTLVSMPVSDLAVNPHLYRRRPFDVLKDLSPVSKVGAVPNILVVSKTLGVRDAKGLIAAARAKPPGTITYSSPGVGSQAHLAAEIFSERAGIKMLHIPYNSVSAALTDVAGGQVDVMFSQLPTALPFIEAGKVQALGMATEARSVLMPDMPTLKEATGLSFGDAISWSGLMAPADTPLALRQKIAQSVSRVMQSAEVQQKLAALGTVGLGGTPQELSQAISDDYQRYGEIVQRLDIRLD
ncbi:MAG TPA: tripartite tricarboxylate transporter substrate binding protein [Bordetella sp.]|nr:tripartite tricarboxylate transporter substrate binding protein [Bordetella sp.]